MHIFPGILKLKIEQQELGAGNGVLGSCYMQIQIQSFTLIMNLKAVKIT